MPGGLRTNSRAAATRDMPTRGAVEGSGVCVIVSSAVKMSVSNELAEVAYAFRKLRGYDENAPGAEGTLP
jgi:hypothetical protein